MKTKFSLYIPNAAERIFLILSLSLLSGVGCSVQQTQGVSLNEADVKTVGWIENGKITSIDKDIKFKLDTGAKTTSINAEILEKPDNDLESGGMIKFKYINDEGIEKIFERPVERWVKIKGEGRRAVVKLKFCIADRWIEEEVNLADRDDFNYSVLIGRNMLKKGKLAVNSAESYTAKSSCQAEDKQNES
ncbi:MAG: RimK/LysX family protein [Rivularia sp. ALOHA_DT_140]|nr:RimK/LysX family protein [Rivularia sp. ALOHA_DT_140]